jgi:TP901 family phage tail tape measure protein
VPTNTVKIVVRAVDQTKAGLATPISNLEKLEASVGRLGPAFKVAGAAVAAFGVYLSKNAVRDAAEFGKAMAEVSTLLPGTASSLSQLTEEAKKLSIEFGKPPVEQAKAFYQIISAGASSAAEATDTLTAANKLAAGGVTSVEVAADGLTTILNSYGDAAGTATDVSDAMFVAMKAGKTTIEQLSVSIGKVAPLAEAAGVSLEELLSAAAALTKGGITTKESMTGLRAVLAAVSKPSSDAQRVASRLGLEFSASGLKAKGFAKFLEEVKEKAGGSTEDLAKLFGGVEALVPVLSLTGKGAEDFSSILLDMSVRAGATEEALAKMSESAQFKFDQATAAAKVFSIEMGDKLISAIVPAGEAIVRNWDAISAIVKTVAVLIASRLVTSLAVYTGTIRLATFETIRYQVALAKMAGSSRAAAVAIAGVGAATRAVDSALRFVGGPLGILVGLLAVASTAWFDFGESAREAGEKVAASIKAAVDSIYNEATGLKALESVYQNRWTIQKRINELEAEKARLLDKSTDAAAAHFGVITDTSAERSLDRVNRQLEEQNVLLEQNEESAGKALEAYRKVKEKAKEKPTETTASKTVEEETRTLGVDLSGVAKDLSLFDVMVDYQFKGLEVKVTDFYDRLGGKEAEFQFTIGEPDTAPALKSLTTFGLLAGELKAGVEEDVTLKFDPKGTYEAAGAIGDYGLAVEAINSKIDGTNLTLGEQIATAERGQLAIGAYTDAFVAAQEGIDIDPATQALVAQGEQLYNLALRYGDVDAAIQALNGSFGEHQAMMSEAQTYIDAYTDAWMEANKTLGQSAVEIGMSIRDNLVGSVTDVITGAQSAGEAIKELGKSVVAMIVQAALKWAVNRAIVSAVGKAFQAAEAAASAAVAATTAAAWAPAAAAVSLATFGANAGPAMAGMSAAFALAQTLAGVSKAAGAAHGGLDFVPKEATYLLDRGERVLSPKQNRDFTKFLSSIGANIDDLSKIADAAGGDVQLPSSIGGAAMMELERLLSGAKVGMAHAGLTNVPKESTYLLDRGERILSRSQNADLTTFLGRERGAEPRPTVIKLMMDGNVLTEWIHDGVRQGTIVLRPT